MSKGVQGENNTNIKTDLEFMHAVFHHMKINVILMTKNIMVKSIFGPQSKEIEHAKYPL